MAQVGMYKQQKYEEGVQKIQNQIDNIAGMDIIRDVDKNYLQSKLNELGSKLKNVAAGDFSNFQLVNSVGGMANQIAKDRNILNAQSSTAWYRKQISDIEAAKKEGKSSISNVWDFHQQAAPWLNGTNPGESFRGTYTPYKDVTKKVLDVVAKLHPKASTEDIAYGINPDGSVNIGKILDAMNRKGIETVDEGQIRTAINSVLDPDDLNQLAIDGRYNLRGLTTEAMVKSTTEDYDTSKRTYSEALLAQRRKLLQTTDLEKQADINRTIRYYEEMLGDPEKGVKGFLADNYEKTIYNIKNDPDAAKASLYTKKYIDQIANGFAWANVKSEILKNPIKENFWDKKNYELNVLKENHAETQRIFERGIAARKDLREQEEHDTKTKPFDPYWKGSGDETTDNLTALENYHNYNSNLQTANDQILNDLAGKLGSINVKLSPKDILVNVDKYRKNQYTPATRYEKDQLDKYIENENMLENQKAIYKTYEDQARQELHVTGELDKDLKNRGSLNIGGQTFTAAEVYNYLKKEHVRTGNIPGPGGSIQTRDVYVNDDDLSNKEKLLKNAFNKRYGNRPYYGSTSTGNSTLDVYLEKFNPVLDKNMKIEAEVMKNIANKLAPITGNFATQQSAIVFKDDGAKGQFVSTLANIAKADLGEKTAGAQYSPSATLGLLTKKPLQDVDFAFKRRGADYYVQVIDKQNPKDVQLVKVDEEFVMKNPSLGNKFLNNNLDLGETLLRNNGTTNIFKDQQHAYFTQGRFGGYDASGLRTVTLPVAADLENQGGQVYPVFYLNTSAGPLRFVYPQPTDITDFKTKYLPSMTDAKVISLFKLQYPNIEQLIQQ